MNSYEKLDPDDVLHLLFEAQNSLQVYRERDDARDDLESEKKKHDETKGKLDGANLREGIWRKKANDLTTQLIAANDELADWRAGRIRREKSK